MTKAEDADYEARVKAFFETDVNESTLQQLGNPHFSWNPCECCERSHGGNRYEMTGISKISNRLERYQFCEDCLYYSAYGKLDDMTMMNITD
jgi:hypothetical protein